MQKLRFVKNANPTYAELDMEMVEKDVGLFATKHKNRRLDPEDLAQELRIHVWNKLHTYNPTKASFRTWLWRVMNSKVIDLTRVKNYKIELFFTIDDPNEDFLRDRDETGQLVTNGSPSD